MSDLYAGDFAVFPTELTIPDDGDPAAAASWLAAINGLADRTMRLATVLRPSFASDGADATLFQTMSSGTPTALTGIMCQLGTEAFPYTMARSGDFVVALVTFDVALASAAAGGFIRLGKKRGPTLGWTEVTGSKRRLTWPSTAQHAHTYFTTLILDADAEAGNAWQLRAEIATDGANNIVVHNFVHMAAFVMRQVTG